MGFFIKSTSMRKVITKGTILYLGHNANVNECPSPFHYQGQSASSHPDDLYVAYFSSYEGAAEGYARCIGPGKGWVNKYVAKHNFSLLDISDEMLHYDAEEVAAEFCPKGGGYYIKWSSTSDEYAICNPWNFLEYYGSKKCIKHGKFSEYECIPK